MRKTALVFCIIFVLAAMASAYAAPGGTSRPQWWPGERPTPKAAGTLTGQIAGITANTLTVQTEHYGAPIFTINGDTRVRGQKSSVADLKVGDKVRIEYNTLPDGNVLARVIAVGENTPPPAPVKVESVGGKVSALSASSITILTEKFGSQTFAITEKTRVVIYGQKATLDQIKVGDNVMVNFVVSDNGTRVANVIGIPIPVFSGKIASLGNDGFVLANKDKTIAVTVTSETKIGSSHGYVGTFADLRGGDNVTVRGVPDNNSIRAIDVMFGVPEIKGVVVSASGNSIVVKTVKQRNITVTGSDATIILIRPRTAPNYKGTPADVKPGMAVNVGGRRTGEGTMSAIWIDVLVP